MMINHRHLFVRHFLYVPWGSWTHQTFDLTIVCREIYQECYYCRSIHWKFIYLTGSTCAMQQLDSNLSMKNTLAYYKHSLITTIKSFITFGPDYVWQCSTFFSKSNIWGYSWVRLARWVGRLLPPAKITRKRASLLAQAQTQKFYNICSWIIWAKKNILKQKLSN